MRLLRQLGNADRAALLQLLTSHGRGSLQRSSRRHLWRAMLHVLLLRWASLHAHRHCTALRPRLKLR